MEREMEDIRLEREMKNMILNYIASESRQVSNAHHLFEYALMTARFDAEGESMFPFVLRQNIDEISCPIPQIRQNLTTPPLRNLKRAADIQYLNEPDFWNYFHMSKKMVKYIRNILHEIAEKQEEAMGLVYPITVTRVPVRTTFYATLWYLRHGDATLEEGAKFFGYNCREDFEAVMKRGLTHIALLKNDAKFCWPSTSETLKTCQHFSEWYRFPTPVCGIMTQRVVRTIDRKRMLVQIISDDRGLIRSASVSYDLRHSVAMIMDKNFLGCLRQVPKGYRIICDGEYEYAPNTLKNEVLITPSDTVLKINAGSEEVHQTLLEAGDYVLESVIKRFPRLAKLHSSLPEAFIAAFILHNYCEMSHDVPPRI